MPELRYSVIKSKANPDNYHVRVTEPILHPTLGFPVGEKTAFSIAMTEEQAELAKEACESGEFAFTLSAEANAAGLYQAIPVL